LTGRLDHFYGTTVLRIAHLLRTGFNDEACARVMANVKLLYDAWSTLEEKGSGID
jgi:hypothetical protein